MSNSRKIILVALALLLTAVATRLLPHAPNATALTAVALAGGVYAGKKWAIILPIFALLISDVFFIGAYDIRLMTSVYGSFAAIGLFSWWLRKQEKDRIVKTAGITVLSSLFFFFVTNSAVWFFAPWYPPTFAGLLESLAMGLPFLRSMLAGDILYVLSIFSVLEMAMNPKRYALLLSPRAFARNSARALPTLMRTLREFPKKL